MDKLSNRFRGNLQQDAHEFLSDLIDFLHDELADDDEDDEDDEEEREKEKEKGEKINPMTPSAESKLSVKEALELKAKAAREAAGAGAVGDHGAFKTPSGKAAGGTILASTDTSPDITPPAKKEAKARVVELPTEKCFRAEICATLQCANSDCRWARSKTEVYRHFSLDIEEVNREGGGVKQVTSIDDALNIFFKPTIVGIRCEKCNCEEATKTLEIKKAPGCLLLHLKRFIVEEGVGKKMVYRKNGGDVNFDGAINLDRFAGKAGLGGGGGEGGRYELKSIVRHIGRDAASGHYVTSAMGEKSDGKWSDYNDSVVSEAKKDEVFKGALSTGYVFCFEAA